MNPIMNPNAVRISRLGELYTAVKLEQSDAKTIPVHLPADRLGVAP